jgi:hypothetical protein
VDALLPVPSPLAACAPRSAVVEEGVTSALYQQAQVQGIDSTGRMQEKHVGSRCAGDTTSQFSSNNRRVGAAMLPAAPRQQGSLPSSVRINNEGGAVSGFRGCWRACLLRV